jgi:hypothetical protein
VAENVKTIKVAYIARKDTRTGKQRWSVKDEDGTWYSAWKQEVADQITPGSTIMAGVEEKEDFKNIVSVIPAGMQATVVDQITAADPKLQSQMDDFFGATSHPTPPPKQTVVDEIRLTVEERMRALDVAALLVAHDKASITDLVAVADRAIAYYHKVTVPGEQKSSSSTSGDVIKEYVQ